MVYGVEPLKGASEIKETLSSHRYLIGVLLLTGSLVNACVRFDGSGQRFFSMLLIQLWFAQAVFNYLRGGWVGIGPGGLSKDANPNARAGLAGFALFAYLVVFFLDFTQG